MVDELLGEILSFAPGNGILVALLAVLPILVYLYVHCSAGARRTRPDLSLGKLEAFELERAVLVYGKVCRRREGLYRTREQAAPNWRALCQARAKFHKKFAAELEELEACAGDLRSTITRVRARPLQRYKFWMRLVSSRFALGRSLACYCLVLLVLIVSSCYIDPPLWAPGSNISFDTFGLWQAVRRPRAACQLDGGQFCRRCDAATLFCAANRIIPGARAPDQGVEKICSR